ncbi:MAG: cupredoxin domain-containing protein [Candidatus Liptonbacteria bacterium]|nr:cupredoxin domain-containing protein [Candidatus Liptonbacteria bacterium]
MKHKNSLIIALVGVLVIVVLVVVAVVLRKRGAVPQEEKSPAPAVRATTTGEIVTRAAVPVNVTVPGEKAVNVPANVAVPVSTAPSSPIYNSTHRTFEFKVEGGKFAPDTLIVNKGDVLRVKITAVDRDYDFTQPDYGIALPLKKGAAVSSEFGVSAEGNFLFYCKSCGGPESGPAGHLIVVPKKP